MSTNPTNFRYPFALPEDIHPQVKNALRLTYQGVKDLNDAIAALVPKVEANSSGLTTVNETVNQTINSGGSGGGGSSPAFGGVNLQPNLTPGAYTLAQSDSGGLILVNSSVAFALTLNSGLVVPFVATVYNVGSGTITATPSTGDVNQGASVTVVPNQLAIFFYDGANWWAVNPLLAQSLPNIAHEWIDSYDASTGLFTQSQPAASDLSNGTQGAGAVLLSSTLPLAGVSASLGGSAMTAGQTINITVSVTGATTSMVASCSPQTYPGDGFTWYATVTAADTVTVYLTAVLAGTPTASLYNVRVVQ